MAGSANEIPIADFTRLFAPGGIYDSYFKSELEAFVNQTRTPWAWRTDGAGNTVGGGVPLAKFETGRADP